MLGDKVWNANYMGNIIYVLSYLNELLVDQDIDQFAYTADSIGKDCLNMRIIIACVATLAF